MAPEKDEVAYMETRYKVSNEELHARVNAAPDMGGAMFVELNELDTSARQDGSLVDDPQEKVRKTQARRMFVLALLCSFIVTIALLAIGVALEGDFK